MFPFSNCNLAKFGSGPVVAINQRPAIATQSGNQGKVAIVQAWDSSRPDLIAELILPTGSPGAPDGFANVTSSNSFFIDQPTGWTKVYLNYRSGDTSLAANATSSHTTQYRVRKAA
jgi:hypothetical protein